MQSLVQRIRESLDEPRELEAIYRQDPQAFRNAIDMVCREVPDSVVLRVWRARLDYREAPGGVDRKRLWYLALTWWS